MADKKDINSEHPHLIPIKFDKGQLHVDTMKDTGEVVFYTRNPKDQETQTQAHLILHKEEKNTGYEVFVPTLEDDKGMPIRYHISTMAGDAITHAVARSGADKPKLKEADQKQLEQIMALMETKNITASAVGQAEDIANHTALPPVPKPDKHHKEDKGTSRA